MPNNLIRRELTFVRLGTFSTLEKAKVPQAALTLSAHSIRTMRGAIIGGFQMSKRSYDYNKEFVPLARELRTGMTKTEKKLWYDFLSLLPVTAHRQKNIGNYIVDFYIPKAKTVIEIDGIQHIDPEEHEKDRERDRDLRSQGMTVLRYSTVRIKTDFDAVKEEILRHIGLDCTETYDYIEKRKKEKEEERQKRFYKDLTKG